MYVCVRVCLSACGWQTHPGVSKRWLFGVQGSFHKCLFSCHQKHLKCLMGKADTSQCCTDFNGKSGFCVCRCVPRLMQSSSSGRIRCIQFEIIMRKIKLKSTSFWQGQYGAESSETDSNDTKSSEKHRFEEFFKWIQTNCVSFQIHQNLICGNSDSPNSNNFQLF